MEDGSQSGEWPLAELSGMSDSAGRQGGSIVKAPQGCQACRAVLGPLPPPPIPSTFSSVRERRGKEASLAGSGNPELWCLGTSSSTLAGTNKLEKDGKFSELALNHAALQRKERR